MKNLEIKISGTKKKNYGKLKILLFQIGSGMRIKIIKPARKFQVGLKKNKILLLRSKNHVIPIFFFK